MDWIARDARSGVDRRTFLRMAGASTMGLTFLVSACTAAPQASPTPAPAPKPTSVPAAPTAVAAAPTAVPAPPTAVARPPTPAPSAPGAALGKLRLPTFVPAAVPPPDFPATESGLQAGYKVYPKTLVKSVATPPGTGGDVTALTSLPFPPSPPLEENTAWQAVNKQLNATVKMRMVPSADYQNAVATTMAGGDLPELFYFNAFGITASEMPRFLRASYTDLTPYLSGDAIKEYPNLAAIPTASWVSTIFDGAIYTVPVARPYVNYVWYINQSWVETAGAKHPKNADDFRRLLKDFTRPQSNQWGIGAGAPAFGLQNGRGDAPQLAMFNVPNNWVIDANGKFTKDVETPQFRAALGWVRDVYADGSFFPEVVPLNSPILKTAFMAGKVAVISTGWISYGQEFWDQGSKLTPPVKIRTIQPFSHDGGKPMWHQFNAAIGVTAVKKSSPERTKELLRILNYLAAPFGSQESLLLEFGLEGTHFQYDPQGNPIKTDKGRTDLNVMWQYLAVRPPVLYYPQDPEFAGVAYADQQAMVSALVRDPSLGLYSAIDRGRGGALIQQFSDGLLPIVTGRSPLSDFDQVLKDWRAAGGDQMRAEYEQAYADSLK
jgi:putative aldouronate transport system substrate-binding protein